MSPCTPCSRSSCPCRSPPRRGSHSHCAAAGARHAEALQLQPQSVVFGKRSAPYQKSRCYRRRGSICCSCSSGSRDDSFVPTCSCPYYSETDLTPECLVLVYISISMSGLWLKTCQKATIPVSVKPMPHTSFNSCFFTACEWDPAFREECDRHTKEFVPQRCEYPWQYQILSYYRNKAVARNILKRPSRSYQFDGNRLSLIIVPFKSSCIHMPAWKNLSLAVCSCMTQATTPIRYQHCKRVTLRPCGNAEGSFAL